MRDMPGIHSSCCTNLCVVGPNIDGLLDLDDIKRKMSIWITILIVVIVIIVVVIVVIITVIIIIIVVTITITITIIIIIIYDMRREISIWSITVPFVEVPDA